jgi:hypothetical protein
MTTPTLSQLGEMTDEELNVRLAELCGWVRLPKNEGWSRAVRESHMLQPDGTNVSSPPDCSRDLNAVHLVEKKLGDTERRRFSERLCNQVQTGLWEYAVSANPRQRTIALILTLTP